MKFTSVGLASTWLYETLPDSPLNNNITHDLDIPSVNRLNSLVLKLALMKITPMLKNRHIALSSRRDKLCFSVLQLHD